jgi:hypothetical protein
MIQQTNARVPVPVKLSHSEKVNKIEEEIS